jgi:hypothetical protein
MESAKFTLTKYLIRPLKKWERTLLDLASRDNLYLTEEAIVIGNLISVINKYAPIRFADLHAKLCEIQLCKYEEIRPLLDELVEEGKVKSLEYALPTGMRGVIYFPPKTEVVWSQ